MSSGSARRTQAVLAVMREIADDPRSTLLRASALDARGTTIDRASSRMAGLSVAERHLLRLHREETALFLRDLIRAAMTQGERSWFTLDRPAEARRRRGMSMDDRIGSWGDRQQLLSDSAALGAISRIAGGRGTQRDVEGLSALALRIEDSAPNRQLRAAVLVDAGQHADARRIYSELSRSPSATRQAQAWSSLGRVASVEGDYATTFEANRRALDLWPGQLLFIANMLAAAVRAQSGDRIQSAATALQDADFNDHLWMRLCRIAARGAKVVVDDPRRNDDFDPPVRRMCHALSASG